MGGTKGRLVKLGSDTSVLATMIKSAREQKQMPNDIFEHLVWYEAWLDTLPSKCMLGGTYVRPHIVRKHMLCFAADRKADGFPVDFSKMNMAQLKRLSPDVSDLLSEVPTMLTPFKLSRLISTPAEYMSMWACLWKGALAVPGAFEFIMLNGHLLLECLTAYKAQHRISPSPRVLVRIARRASSVDDDHDGGGEAGQEDS
jgi:hypothetical protein